MQRRSSPLATAQVGDSAGSSLSAVATETIVCCARSRPSSRRSLPTARFTSAQPSPSSSNPPCARSRLWTAKDPIFSRSAFLLLRTESVASSKIEAVEASADDYARALHGIRSNSSAVSMAAATTALDSMITGVARGGDVELAAVTAAHLVLMRDDPAEARYAGRLRDMQKWIGGSAYSPRTAIYVPPPPEMVPTYMADLIAFVNRDDLPALAQAALAHAQFESIHPFTDGNGRIGRALINTVL